MATRVLRFFAALAVVTITTAANAQDNPDAALRRAVAAQKAGNAERAITEYREFLQRHPEAADVRSNLGAALASAGRYEEAIVEYRTALKTRQGDPHIRLNLALALYKAGHIAEAADSLALLHAAQPADHQILLLLADCWLRQGLDANVIDLLAPIDKQEGDLAIAYLLGTALIRNRQTERGEEILDRILRHGDSAEARLLMGTAKLNAMEFNAAIVDLEKAEQLNPQLPEVHSFLGTAHKETGDMAAARRDFERELELNPNDFDSNLNLAVLLKQDQDYSGARKLLDRAIKVRPDDPGVLYQFASIDIATGKIDAARGELESLVRVSPQFVEAHISLAAVYYRLRRKEDGDREKALVQKLNAEKEARKSR
jgi:Flp pilus assembly protein TadD